MEYSESMLALHSFIPKVSTKSLDRILWVTLDHLRFGVGRFCCSMYKRSLTFFSNCELGETEQNIDHIIKKFHALISLTNDRFDDLNDGTRSWLKSFAILSVLGSKKIYPLYWASLIFSERKAPLNDIANL